jgi:DNA-binding HxlR family transcriptional regulator
MDLENAKKKGFTGFENCPVQSVLAIKDTLNILNGKWKLPIITTLLFDISRYTDIQKAIPNVTPRMLSKELKDLEMNGVVQRNVYDDTPVRVEYTLTESGKSIADLLEKMIDWGKMHRKRMMQK